MFEHLERLREDGGIKLSLRRLISKLEKVGATATPVNLTRAQPVYLRALAAALLQAEQRYGTRPTSDLDFDALVEQARPDASASVGDGRPSQALPPNPPQPITTPEPVQPERTEISSSRITVTARQFEEKRVQDNEWDDKTCRQARFIFTLFARYMQEVHGLDQLCSLRQSHLADFDSFLRGLHANFGKSTKDPHRSIPEILALVGQQVTEHGVLQGATRNRHLTFLGQLIAYARGRGLAIEPALTTTPFRARKQKRGRDQRAVPEKEKVVELFQRPVFVVYAGWDDIDTPGEQFFHRAEYFCSILAAYEGARREEYCGLGVDDVITDNDGLPYIHISPNEFRASRTHNRCGIWRCTPRWFASVSSTMSMP